MSEAHLPFGTMKENDGLIIVDIPLSDTNIADTEQLEELKREDPFFFSCQHYIEEEGSIHIYYKRPSDYEPLTSVELTHEKKTQIAKQILQAEKINGTQYTTSFNPENIYVNQEGSVKLAHRGIRSIIPPEALSGVGFLQEVKQFLIYLYTGQSFQDINTEAAHAHDNAFINKMMAAGSVGELKNIIEETLVPDTATGEADIGPQQGLASQPETDIPEQTPPPGLGAETPPPPSHDSAPLGLGSLQQGQDPQNQEPTQPGSGLANNQQRAAAIPKPKPKPKEKPKKESESNKKTNPLVIGLFGFVCGLLVLYLFQVMPLDKEKEELEEFYNAASAETESLEDDYESLEEDNEALKDEIATHERVEEAYGLALRDQKEEAIQILEQVDPVDDEVKDTLINWYINVGSLENLQKALELDGGHDTEIAEELAKLDDDAAVAVIQNMQPTEPGVMLEQAWIEENYDDVISIYEDDLEDNSRAKYLAAKSYIEQDKPDKAKKLGESLKNKDVQISALKKEKELIDNDDDLDKDERKDEKKKIDKEIKKLKK